MERERQRELEEREAEREAETYTSKKAAALQAFQTKMFKFKHSFEEAQRAKPSPEQLKRIATVKEGVAIAAAEAKAAGVAEGDLHLALATASGST